jgi:hypothetical protein
VARRPGYPTPARFRGQNNPARSGLTADKLRRRAAQLRQIARGVTDRLLMAQLEAEASGLDLQAKALEGETAAEAPARNAP